MTKGKTICSVLKSIRKQVADANDIEYEPLECNHQGECRGTCPACEREVSYIEKQLDIRRQLGKAVTIVGLSAGLFTLAGVTSCNNFRSQTAGYMEEVVPDSINAVLLKEKDSLKAKLLKEDSLIQTDGLIDSEDTLCPEEESPANKHSQ